MASIKVHSMGFQQNLLNTKSTILEKAPNTLTGSFFARTDKLYTKRYEEETNLRCHMILDNSASMHYPETKYLSLKNLNKIGFGVLSIAALMNLLKKQRDAVGLSLFGETNTFYAPEKSSERHFQMLLAQLNALVQSKSDEKKTKTYHFLHHISEKIHRRSLIFVFTDMFQVEVDEEKLFQALRHLKYNKHQRRKQVCVSAPRIGMPGAADQSTCPFLCDRRFTGTVA